MRHLSLRVMHRSVYLDGWNPAISLQSAMTVPRGKIVPQNRPENLSTYLHESQGFSRSTERLSRLDEWSGSFSVPFQWDTERHPVGNGAGFRYGSPPDRPKVASTTRGVAVDRNEALPVSHMAEGRPAFSFSVSRSPTTRDPRGRFRLEGLSFGRFVADSAGSAHRGDTSPRAGRSHLPTPKRRAGKRDM
jgi:hypothetical protein